MTEVDMMDERARVLEKLDELRVAYEMDVHEPVYTIEAMVALGLDKKGIVVKNLFLRDAKGKRHFLVVLPGDRQGDLKAIRDQLGSTALSFGSEERLMRCLKLTKGAVSPLGSSTTRNTPSRWSSTGPWWGRNAWAYTPTTIPPRSGSPTTGSARSSTTAATRCTSSDCRTSPLDAP